MEMFAARLQDDGHEQEDSERLVGGGVGPVERLGLEAEAHCDEEQHEAEGLEAAVEVPPEGVPVLQEARREDPRGEEEHPHNHLQDAVRLRKRGDESEDGSRGGGSVQGGNPCMKRVKLDGQEALVKPSKNRSYTQKGA
jgi:hypothetical protein